MEPSHPIKHKSITKIKPPEAESHIMSETSNESGINDNDRSNFTVPTTMMGDEKGGLHSARLSEDNSADGSRRKKG